MATLTEGLLENHIPVVAYHGLNTNKNITVGGSSAVDMSGSTGIFKTPTGAVTIGDGAVTISGAITYTSTTPPIGRKAPVTASGGATRTLTAANSGSVNLFDAASGVAYTLPTPAVGLVYDFVVTVAQTSGTNSVITAVTASQFIRGYITMFSDVDITPSATLGPKGFAGDGTSHVKINTNATTTGGGIGSWLRLIGVSTTVWQAYGIIRSPSGTIATPFLVA